MREVGSGGKLEKGDQGSAVGALIVSVLKKVFHFSVDNFIPVMAGRMETQNLTISFISCCFYIILLSFVECSQTLTFQLLYT